MKAKNLISSYLQKQHMMQLATFSSDQPWICNLYYVVDDNFNLYWLSLKSRRHSQEILKQKKVAAAIPVNFDIGEKVVGLQIQGIAERIKSNNDSRNIADLYAKKFLRTNKWVDDFCNNQTDHKLYKLTPELFVLFDEINFPNQPRQEFLINDL